jgi:hypothetical protein
LKFESNTIQDAVFTTAYSFTWATHVYNASYNKTISKRQDTTPVVSYINNTNNQAIYLANT